MATARLAAESVAEAARIPWYVWSTVAAITSAMVGARNRVFGTHYFGYADPAGLVYNPDQFYPPREDTGGVLDRDDAGARHCRGHDANWSRVGGLDAADSSVDEAVTS
jgi:hypothetical protein